MKYKQKKMWKPWILFIFIFVLFYTIPAGYAYIKTQNKNNKKTVETDESKLKNIGYSLNDISIIINNKKYKNYALKNKYDTDLMDYIKITNFNIDNLDKYKKYKKYNNDASLEDVVKIVNLDINTPYSDKLINIINSKYFIKSKINRYLNYNNKSETNDIIKYVNCNLDRSYYTETLQTDITKGILMLTNKYHYLNNDYNGLNLVSIENGYGTGKMNSEAYEKFKIMCDDAKAQGLNILAQSTFRSFQAQEIIYNNYLSQNGQIWTDQFSARPGYSEHQTGLAVDVRSYNTYNLGDFIYTNEYKWMINNSYKYGFILRYKETDKEITGYDFEPWHYRYVGLNAAKIIYDEKISFDEYYAYYVEKEDKN